MRTDESTSILILYHTTGNNKMKEIQLTYHWREYFLMIIMGYQEDVWWDQIKWISIYIKQLK